MPDPGEVDDPSRTPLDEKRRVRREARTRRSQLSVDDRARWSEVIAERVAALIPPEGLVMTYVAMRDELDLGSLNDSLASGGRLVLPRVEGDRLAAVPHRAGDPLVVSRFGVPEPTGDDLDPEHLVAVIVPGLAFDPAGYRVGYGAGFYDRFLPLLRADCLVVGACFAAQLVDEVPRELHDIAVGLVVTEVTGP